MSDEDLAPGEGGELSRSPDGAEERRVSYEQWFGPVPDPQTLRQFEEVVPGSGERLIGAFEIQVHGRLAHEHYEAVTRRHGLYLVFILSLVLIGAGAYGLHVGYGWGMVPVSALALGSLFTSVRHMLRRSRRGRPNNEE